MSHLGIFLFFIMVLCASFATSSESTLHQKEESNSFDAVEGRNETSSDITAQVHGTLSRGFQGTRTRRRQPSGKKKQRVPVRRQDSGGGGGGGGPGLNVTSVSPLELTLGGLTGLQGLPPLSIIQFVKLLAAITPFLIPLIFVPILIFTVGIFMIPVQKPNIFVEGGGNRKLRNRNRPQQSTNENGWFLLPAVKNAAYNFANYDECLELLICHIGERYLPKNNRSTYVTTIERISQASDSLQWIKRLARSLNHAGCQFKCKLTSTFL